MTLTAPETGLPTTDAAPPTLYLTRNYDWRDDASCRTVDPELFFPSGAGGLSAQQERNAKLVCRGCPVREECLKAAVDTGQYTGVWGGLSEAERRGMVRGGDTAFSRCLEAQQYIEERLAQKAPRRVIAGELGVSYEILRRACLYFRNEQAILAKQQGVSA